jgi:hypothetical protein
LWPAIEQPLPQIVENAGEDAAVVLRAANGGLDLPSERIRAGHQAGVNHTAAAFDLTACCPTSTRSRQCCQLPTGAR